MEYEKHEIVFSYESWDGFYNSLCGPALKIEEVQDEFSPQTVKPTSKSGSKDKEEEYRTKIRLNLAVASLIRGYQVREIISRLEKVYCQSIGIEYMHMYDVDAVRWLRKKMEMPGATDIQDCEKKDIMRRLTKAVFLEKYFASKWPAEKRFGLEGGESLILMMEEIVDTSTKLGVESIIVAMQHRGRLNMLVNVCRKQLADVFAQFRPLEPKESVSGDVKYHLGTNIHRFIRRTNRYIKVAMSANPSHLEVVGPVVMAIIMHGDAAICGQGVVFETIGQGSLPNFTTHGTTHNAAAQGKQFCHFADVAKCVDAPVMHVNADDPEAVAYVARVAIQFRCKFKKDVVLDLVCYRRHGHSEEDEPMYTQPFMYKKIKTMRTIDLMYADHLKATGIASEADIKKWEKEYTDTLNKHFEMSKKITKLSIMDWVDTPWTGFFENVNPNVIKETGISQQTVATITSHFVKPPDPWAFELHPGVTKILENRAKLGPEHSSGRIERYLQQCDDDEEAIPNLDDKNMALKQLRAANWIVANPTTPANYFHMIRRQIALPFRKPLITFSPKVGLKHPYFRSPLKDFYLGTSFQRVIPEDGPASKNPGGVKKLIFCSGNVAIKINDARKEKKLEDKIAICRVEQLFPFPYDMVLKEFCKYEKAKKFWCQEEHRNQGPWLFCKVRMENLFQQKIGCISRPSSPASATGIKWVHMKEIKDLKAKMVELT
ncbi:hypothetical protein HF086_012241 [Spodoptera exigua]|uniref:2-oxoglutarate dehydrogenase n=1 Tax=Spodoptera exigua TaxID=7107 RepID=A0A922MDA9_SPOEX|nr:hypothetical protein HF086_012241 [Spodoptera exigua]